jgi:hypothetical protein
MALPKRPNLCGHEPYYAAGFCQRCYNHRYQATEAQRQKQAEYRQRTREYAKEYSKLYSQKHRAALKLKARTLRLKSKYGLSDAEYQALYDKQGGCCAMCIKPFALLAVDHDHETDAIRGLLCTACNVGLGIIEKKGFLDSAMSYLDQYKDAIVDA